MKKSILLLIAFCAISTFGFAQKTLSTKNKKQSTVTVMEYYGDSIGITNAIPAAQLPNVMGDAKEKDNIRIEGVVQEVCQKKGCWMTMRMADGETIRITFKDYGFFLPMDASGRKAIMEGKAFVAVTSVEELKHYAEDAKKSKEEIAKITKPERKLTFEARGVVLQ